MSFPTGRSRHCTKKGNRAVKTILPKAKNPRANLQDWLAARALKQLYPGLSFLDPDTQIDLKTGIINQAWCNVPKSLDDRKALKKKVDELCSEIPGFDHQTLHINNCGMTEDGSPRVFDLEELYPLLVVRDWI